jgi:hypothetical protein
VGGEIGAEVHGGGDGAGAADANCGGVGEGVEIERIGTGESGVGGVEENAREPGVGREGGAEINVSEDADLSAVGDDGAGGDAVEGGVCADGEGEGEGGAWLTKMDCAVTREPEMPAEAPLVRRRLPLKLLVGPLPANEKLPMESVRLELPTKEPPTPMVVWVVAVRKLSAVSTSVLATLIRELLDLKVPPLRVRNSLNVPEEFSKRVPPELMVVPSAAEVEEPRAVELEATRVPLLMVMAPV